MTSFTLKIIGITAMLIDHIGAILLPVFRLQPLLVFRVIGRLAFPIFAFCIVEGCLHTRNMGKYLFRLVCFALLSELPYDLFGMFTQMVPVDFVWMDWNQQNVFFTLALGTMAIWLLKIAAQEPGKKVAAYVFTGFLILAGDLFHTDYGSLGVLLIVALYISAEKGKGQRFRWWQGVIIALIFFLFYYDVGFIYILGACCAVPLFMTYNGKPGPKIKWLFYIFYPTHLLILACIGRRLWS